MPLQTNYSLLYSSAPSIAQQVIRFTGNPAIYGYETPINISDLVTGLNTQVALSTIPYCTTPTVVVGQNLGISMVEQLLYIWGTVFNGDTSLQQFLYMLNLYVNFNVTSPDRFDYCGKDLGGSQLFTIAQLQSQLTAILAKINALNLVAVPQTYYTMIENPTQVPLTPAIEAAIVPGTTKVTFPQDPTTGIIGINGTYILHQIPDAIALDQYVQNTFIYSTDTVDFYQVSYNPLTLSTGASGGSNPETAYNNLNQAAVWLGQAAQAAFNQVLEGTNAYLTSIYSYLLSAISDYQAYLLAPIIQTFSSINQAATGGFNPPSTQTGVPSIDSVGQAMLDAGLNARAVLLRTYLYVLAFDKNGDNIIEPSERITMEVDILKRMQAVRLAFLTNYLASFSTQLNQGDGIPASLPGVIVTAVS